MIAGTLPLGKPLLCQSRQQVDLDMYSEEENEGRATPSHNG